MPARLVVSMPSVARGPHALAFASEVRRRGADLVVVDARALAESEVEPRALKRACPYLVRGSSLAEVKAAWWECADSVIVDADTRTGGTARAIVCSTFDAPTSTADAIARWRGFGLPKKSRVLHLEPVGSVRDAARFFETQRELGKLFSQVSVLPQGPLAVPFRCALSERNALDWVAVGFDDAGSEARLLDDAAREKESSVRHDRLGILGSNLRHSHAPEVHRPPFDRLTLSPDVAVTELLEVLHPHYHGFSVSSPFQVAVARKLGLADDAVNTLVRTEDGWRGENTDPDGARVVLKRLRAKSVTALGSGGATRALRAVASEFDVALRVFRRAELAGVTLDGPCIWTWADAIELPETFRFAEGTPVAVIAYGEPAKRIAADIRARGGAPKLMGSAWFIAATRRQRELWEEPR
jgi:hypothetical protein